MIAAGAVIARRWRPITETTLIDVVSDTQVKAAGANLPH